MSTAGPKSPFEEASILRLWRRKAKCPVLVTTHKLFWISITKQMPPHKHLCAAVVLHWSFSRSQTNSVLHWWTTCDPARKTCSYNWEQLSLIKWKLRMLLSMTSSQSKGWHGCYKEHRVMNQDPPIHPQFNIIPRYPNTPAFNYSWPGRKGNRVRYIYTRKLN